MRRVCRYTNCSKHQSKGYVVNYVDACFFVLNYFVRFHEEVRYPFCIVKLRCETPMSVTTQLTAIINVQKRLDPRETHRIFLTDFLSQRYNSSK